MEKPRTNPFSKNDYNLTTQMQIEKQDHALAEKLRAEAKIADAEHERKQRTRNLAKFNEMDKDGKIKFIRNDGEVVH